MQKSANVFFQRTMEMTLGCTFVRDLMPDNLDRFFALERAVGGEHFLPTEENLTLLKIYGVEKVGILVRDPRDAIVSMWRHYERPDIKARGSRSLSSNYYTLGPQEKLRELILNRFPVFQGWITKWMETIANNSAPPEYHVIRFEDFVVDRERAVRGLLNFFGHDIAPVFPTVEGEREAGIHAFTHFRRGQVGPYRDEASPELVRLFDDRIDRRLAKQMGWS